MTPVKQTILFGDNAIGSGNCVAACYASLLDIPLWCVPPWEQMFGRHDYQKRQTEWLKRFFNLQKVCISHMDFPEWLEDGEAKAIRDALEKLPEFYMACGRTVRGSHHACIYSDGKLVHDPHFSDEGLLAVDTIYYFEPIPEEDPRIDVNS